MLSELTVLLCVVLLLSIIFLTESRGQRFCQGRGYRNSHGKCVCSDGYYGANCEYSMLIITFSYFLSVLLKAVVDRTMSVWKVLVVASKRKRCPLHAIGHMF